jgi:hypothetical protein
MHATNSVGNVCDVNLTTGILLVPRLRTVELYLHSPITFHGTMLNDFIKYWNTFTFAKVIMFYRISTLKVVRLATLQLLLYVKIYNKKLFRNHANRRESVRNLRQGDGIWLCATSGATDHSRWLTINLVVVWGNKPMARWCLDYECNLVFSNWTFVAFCPHAKLKLQVTVQPSLLH